MCLVAMDNFWLSSPIRFVSLDTTGYNDVDITIIFIWQKKTIVNHKWWLWVQSKLFFESFGCPDFRKYMPILLLYSLHTRKRLGLLASDNMNFSQISTNYHPPPTIPPTPIQYPDCISHDHVSKLMSPYTHISRSRSRLTRANRGTQREEPPHRHSPEYCYT